jgi:hypothetical protein
MATKSFSQPVKESVSKVNDEVEVGEDLDFQRRWWRFENVVWVLFTLIIVLDLCGLFGRGPIARAERRSADGTMNIRYERIERTETPSILSIGFGQSAIVGGKVRLYVSESMVQGLGTQRIIPAPLETQVGDGGLTYTFPATRAPASVDFALQPSGPGIYDFTLRAAGGQPIQAKVFVVP